MKTTIKFVVVFLIISLSNLTAQVKDSLIVIHPIIGKNVNIYENDTYDLFPQISGFKSAAFYIRNNKFLVSKIKFVTSTGVEKDTSIVEPLLRLQNKRARIRLIYLEKKDKIGKGRRVRIVTKNGSVFTGNIARITNKGVVLYLNLNNNYARLPEENFITIPREELLQVIILGESNVWSGIGWGTLIGMGSGALIGFASGNDEHGIIAFTAGQKALITGVSLGVIGGIIGLVSGLVTSSNKVVINIKNDSDYNKLKVKFPYSF